MPKKCVCASSVILKDGKVLLLWHEKLGIWLYPGGHVERNETPQETAVREAEEETGMKIRITNPDKKESQTMKSKEASELPRPFLILHERVPYKTGEHEHFDMVYLAKLQSANEEKRLGEGEAKKMGWFGKKEIKSLKTFGNVRWVLNNAIDHSTRGRH